MNPLHFVRWRWKGRPWSSWHIIAPDNERRSILCGLTWPLALERNCWGLIFAAGTSVNAFWRRNRGHMCPNCTRELRKLEPTP